MDSHVLKPERITKPIQLLAAWLVGLFATNASFLLAAQKIDHPSWGPAVLLIASVVNVPIFIVALFLLQTKFRPQMQEDPYYSKYLDEERRNAAAVAPDRNFDQEIAKTTEQIVASLGASAKGKEKPISDILQQNQVDFLVGKHGGTRSLSELYTSPSYWKEVASRFAGDPLFDREIEGLIEDGLVTLKGSDLSTARLTNLGRSVAAAAEESGGLFLQLHPSRWSRMRKALSHED